MNRDRLLWILVAGVAATYPGLALAWCLIMLLGLHPRARTLAVTDLPGLVAAVVLTVISGFAVYNAVSTLARSLHHTRRLHRRIARRRITTPGWLEAEAAAIGIGRLAVVADDARHAVTVGLVRPCVVVSTGLVAGLPTAGLRAVLAHERSHQRHRDPLRHLAARVAAAHLWFLPIAADLRGRAGLEHELAADRHAAEAHGRTALAGALLRVTAPSGSTVAAVRGFADASLLDARVGQLETGRTAATAWTSLSRSAISAIGALGFAVTVAAAWGLMVLACPCGM